MSRSEWRLKRAAPPAAACVVSLVLVGFGVGLRTLRDEVRLTEAAASVLLAASPGAPRTSVENLLGRPRRQLGAIKDAPPGWTAVLYDSYDLLEHEYPVDFEVDYDGKDRVARLVFLSQPQFAGRLGR